MISVEKAKELVFNKTNATTTQERFLIDCIGYYLSEDVISPIDMPPFRQSAMDGYALNMHDSENYKVIGETKAGDSCNPNLKIGEAVRIFTGAAVPDSANAVMMQEKVVSNENSIILTSKVTAEANIRPKGEQVKKGAVALKKGTCLTPAAIGFLATLGITKALVFKKPTIAIIVTGNELTEAGDILTYGKIFESNTIMLQSALLKSGFTDMQIYRVNDVYEETVKTLESAISKSDVVLVTGGISVGDYDFVGKALGELKVKEVFYKVKQKPGKPLYFGERNNTSVFALPGNPAAALSCFYIYVYPALQNRSGASNFKLKQSKEKSTSSFIKKGDRSQFLKAIYNAGEVSILEGQSSAMLQTFALANAFVYVPENLNTIAIGDTVEVIHFPH